MSITVWFRELWGKRSPDEVLKDHLIQLDETINVETNEKGRGAYGSVFEVKYNGATCIGKRILDILTGGGGNLPVDRDQYMPLVDRFRAECDLLSKLRHPNIVQFIGICQPTPDPRDLTLVMEKMEIDLGKFIYEFKPINSTIKHGILCDISAGLMHIHSHNVIHRDLNAGNVLLTQDLRAKVADFGMSRVVKSHVIHQGSMTIMPGAPDYMPPEATTGEYDIKIDTFSFGHVMLYLLLEVYPAPLYLTAKGLLNLGQLEDNNLEILRRKQWLDKLGEDHPLYKLVKDCLKDEPEERPTMAKISRQLTMTNVFKDKNFASVSFKLHTTVQCALHALQKEFKLSQGKNEGSEEKGVIIQERDTLAQEKNTLLQEKEVLIQERDTLAQEKNTFLQEKVERDQEKEVLIQERDTLAQEKNALLQEKEFLIQEKDALSQEKNALLQEKEERDQEKEVLIQEKDTLAQEKNTILRERNILIEQRDALIQGKETLLQEKEIVTQEKEALFQQIHNTLIQLQEHAKENTLEEKKKLAATEEAKDEIHQSMSEQIKKDSEVVIQMLLEKENEISKLQQENSQLKQEKRQLIEEIKEPTCKLAYDDTIKPLPPVPAKRPRSSSASKRPTNSTAAATTTSDENNTLSQGNYKSPFAYIPHCDNDDQPLTSLQAKLNRQLQKIDTALPEQEKTKISQEQKVRMRHTEPGGQRDILRRQSQTLPRSNTVTFVPSSDVDFTREIAPELAQKLQKWRSKAELPTNNNT